MAINLSLCTGCDACRKECPTFAVKKQEGIYSIEPEQCIKCAHCAAVCPVSAVEGCSTIPVKPFLPSTTDFLNFQLQKRSIRRYTSDPVSEKDLGVICASAMSAATASNTMDWQLYIYSGEKLAGLRKAMLELFKRFAGLIKIVLTNPLFRLIGRSTAARPYVIRKKTADTFAAYLDEIKKGNDPLLFNAPVMMVLTSPKHTSAYGPVNCAIAGCQMMETALTLGIGSCMVGFAEHMLNMFPKIKKQAGIPRSQKVFLVFTLGHSKIKFHASPLRNFCVFLNNKEFKPDFKP